MIEEGAPGQVYEYFRDLKQIIARAEQQLFVIDPYFNGRAFDDYLSEVSGNIETRILAERYSKETKAYADRHIVLQRAKALYATERNCPGGSK